jgi:hypothetical protein
MIALQLQESKVHEQAKQEQKQNQNQNQNQEQKQEQEDQEGSRCGRSRSKCSRRSLSIRQQDEEGEWRGTNSSK